MCLIVMSHDTGPLTLSLQCWVLVSKGTEDTATPKAFVVPVFPWFLPSSIAVSQDCPPLAPLTISEMILQRNHQFWETPWTIPYSSDYCWLLLIMSDINHEQPFTTMIIYS